MEAERFDASLRTLPARAGSRRSALRGLAAAALAGLLPIAAASAAKPKPKCGLAGKPCCKTPGKAPCKTGAVCNKVGYCKCKRGLQACAGACITRADCCVDGRPVKDGKVARGQCGLCSSGIVAASHIPCAGTDPEGCHACDPATYRCKPDWDGSACLLTQCGVCKAGTCDTSGRTVCGRNCCLAGETCCGDGQCCGEGSVCCPTRYGDRTCRQPDPVCGSCSFQCGPLCCADTQYCAKCADNTLKCTGSPDETC